MAQYAPQARKRAVTHREQSGNIYWTQAEKKQVADEAFYRLQRDKSLSSIEAIEQAQRKTLPKNRQREGLTHIGFAKFKPWIEPLWHEIGEKQGKQANARVQAEQLFLTSPPEPQPAQEPAAPEPEAQNENEEMAANNPQEIQTVVGAALAAAMDKKGADKIATKPNPPGKHGGSRKMPEKITRWTNDERVWFITRVDALRAEDTMLSLTRAAHRANAEMPPERQRTSTDWSWANIAPWADSMLKIAKSERMAREHKAQQDAEAARQAAESAEARAKAEQAEIDAAIANNTEALEAREREIEARIDAEVEARVAAAEARMREQQVARPLEGIIQLFADRFAEVAVKSFAGAINRAVSDQMMAMRIDAAVPTPRVATPVEKAIAPPRERLPKVCVVGLINQQEQDVKRAFEDTIDFVFVKSQTQGGSGGHGGAGMLAKANSCDIVACMTDFVGHDVEWAAKKLNIPYYRVNGSVSGLKRWLTEWLTGGYSGNGG
jgi:hypothetical protein